MKTTFKHSEQIEAKRFYNSLQGNKTFKALPNGFVVIHESQQDYFDDNVACLSLLLKGN